MNMPYLRAFELMPPDEIHAARPVKPMKHEDEEDGLEGAPSPRQRAEEHP